MKRYLYFDSEKCSACGACALACMDQNDIDIPAGEQPFRHTFTLEGKTGDLHALRGRALCHGMPLRLPYQGR